MLGSDGRRLAAEAAERCVLELQLLGGGAALGAEAGAAGAGMQSPVVWSEECQLCARVAEQALRFVLGEGNHRA